MTARDEWRWTDERGVQRLVGTDELRAALASSVLPPSTLVWREGMKEWAPAFTMPELASAAIAAARTGGESDAGAENTPTEVDVPGRAPLSGGRGEMRTLLGLNAPEAKDRQSAPIVPIVVPTAGGTTPGGRDVITQLPKFKDEQAAAEASNPVIPQAPRMPGRPAAPASRAPVHPGSPTGSAAVPLANIPKQRQRTQTMQGVGLQRGNALRTKTTSDIDSLWAAPSPGEESSRSDAFAKPRPAAGAPAEIANEDTGDRPSSTEVEEMEIVSERVPAPPKLPDFGARAKGTGTRPPGPPPKAPAGPRKPLSSIPPPLPRRQPSIPPGALKPTATGVESRAPGTQRPQAPPLPPKRGGSERPPMKSTPPPAPLKRSHPPPPLKSRAPQPSSENLEQKAAIGEADAAKAALDAVDVEITTDGLVAEASTTPAPVAVFDKPTVDAKAATDTKATVEATPPAGKSEATKPVSATSTPAPTAAAAAATGTATATSTPAPASATAAAKATPPPRSVTEDAASARSAKPASVAPALPTKHSATATPAPVASTTSAASASASATPEATKAPPPVAEKKPAPEAAAAASLTPPPARIPIRDKADLSGTPTAPVAPRERVGAAREATAAREEASDATGPQRKLGESVNVPVSSLMVAGGALIVMAMTGFLVGRCSTAAAPAARALSGVSLVVGRAHASAPSAPKSCGVARNAKRWAPRASKTIPFELFATPGGKLAVGYARDDTEAGGLEMDPASGEAKESFKGDTTETIEHVMPNPTGGFTVIAPGESAALKNAIQVPTSPPFFVGVSDGAIVSSDKADAAGPKLWALAGADTINSERVEEARAKGFAYSFRQGNEVFGGWIGADRRAVGELVKVAGSGGSVGKPMSAFNGKEIAVIFADRPAGAAHWQIRVGHAPAGSMPSQTAVIPLPKGGPGGDAFAPDIAGLADGRWVLVWTEGPPGGRAVRAQTLSPRFEPIGDPMALSPPAGNFGQGVLGVIGGRATVVFLSKGSQSFELWGAVLQCG